MKTKSVIFVLFGLLLGGCATPSLNESIQLQQTDKTRSLIAARQAINEADKLGNTPLHYAVQKLDRDLVASLLEAGAAVNAQNNDGETPLFTLLRKAGYYPEITNLLLDHRADPNRANKAGLTPLHFAVDAICHSVDYAAKVQCVRSLLEHGGDVNQVDAAGRSALHFAASGRPLQVLKLVAGKVSDLGAMTSPAGFNAYTLAVIHGKRDEARFLAQKGLAPQLIASTQILPNKVALQPWEVNQAAKINALAHDWHAAWLVEQGAATELVSRTFATVREQYDLAAAEYIRARQQCTIEIPKAKSELATQKAGAAVRNILGTAVGLVAGYNTGVGFVSYSVGGFSNRPDYLAWLLSQYDRELTALQSRSSTLQRPDLLATREYWTGEKKAEPRGKWRDAIAMIGGFTVTLNGQRLGGNTTRDMEIKRAIDETIGELRQSGLIADVNPDDDRPTGKRVTITVAFVEKENLHLASAAGKGFAVGFFTLGMFGNFTSGTYSYETRVNVTLDADGAETALLTASAGKTVHYPQNIAGAGAKAGSETRGAVTRQALAEIVAQLGR